MNPEDDPEARIRALEQPLANQAQASEMGGSGQPSPGPAPAYLPPPVQQPYSAPDYSTPSYGSPPPYSGDAYGTQQPYGTPYTPQRKVSGGIPWLVFGIIAAIFVIGIGAGAVFFTRNMNSGSGPLISTGSGGATISLPSIPAPSIPLPPGSNPNAPSDQGVETASPGSQFTVAGIDSTRTIACNDAAVSVSGIRNTVNITGHCSNISVSGMNNNITVDAVDSVTASGDGNTVTYHGGNPQITSIGANNVQQG
jgi:hypothetical protein